MVKGTEYDKALLRATFEKNVAGDERRRKIAAWVLYPYGDVPGQRFRIQQWEPFLKDRGIDLDYYSFSDPQLVRLMPLAGHTLGKIMGLLRGHFRRIRHLFDLRGYDAVYIYRAATMVGPAIFERIIALLGYPIIYDFDDAIFIPHTAASNRAFRLAKFAGKTAVICRLSRAITVGNSYLADYARQYNSNVFIVPTGVDIEEFSPRERKGNDRPVLGWVGSSTSQTYLEAFEPTLIEMLQERDIELRVISDRRPEFKNVPHTWIPWSREEEVEQITGFDIGIMPLADEDWARGKCAFKALQYMALGVPAICSDIGANRDVIDHGINGMLAGTREEWRRALRVLVDDVGLRRKLGEKARETIRSRYSMTASSTAFAKAVDTVFAEADNK